jgi:MFS family permease
MFSTARKRYVLVMLTLVCVLSFVDSGLVALLLQPIKVDLNLSDTQLGLLTGIAFALFYATLGLPMARWADRGNRSTITSLALALWALAVMACLFVTNFAQLLLTRVGNAVGDAGIKPPTYSLLGDYFPEPAERTRAMAIYWSAGPLAALVSFILGGWLSELYGWRLTMFVMGLPGLLVAVLFKMTITEPRALVSHVPVSHQPSASMKDVLVTMWQRRATRHLTIALILLQMMTTGMNPWFAAFMMRSHGMGTAEVGVWLGLIFGIGGMGGALLGGYVASRWYRNDERGQMRLSALTIGSLVAWFAAFLLLPHKYQALITLCPLMITFGFFLGPTYAVLQRLVPAEMRATSLALLMLFGNLIGLGLGPLIVGVLSDALMPALGSESLRYAMLMMSLVALWSAYHFWQIGRTVREDLITVEGWS